MSSHHARHLLAWLCALCALVLAIPALAAPGEPPDSPGTPTATPQPGGTAQPGEAEEAAGPLIPQILEKPVIPEENATLADRGSQVYWFVCLACHGNAGQGLTEAWRREAFGEDMNCWVSRCHAANHPPEGFEFPRVVPPVVGSGTLMRFVTAQELYEYLMATMPWWNPRYLSEGEGWQLTAFLLRANGRLADRQELDTSEAALLPVHLPVRSPRGDRLATLAAAACFGLAAVALATARRFAGSAETPTGRPNFVLHLHPPTIPAAQARLRYTLGAGGLAVFLCLVLTVTGILELYFYIPTPEQAGPSIQVITFAVPLGGIVRNLHFWSAQLLVGVVVLHLVRVVFTGAYAAPRRFNFVLGVGLLVLILLLDFTGYVLRWDEGIRWALMVGTNLLKTIPLAGERLYGFVVGGDQPGAATLIRFYAWHIFGLTLVMVVGLAWHLFRVRRDGGIAVPVAHERAAHERVARERHAVARISRSELGRREGLAMAVAGALLLAAAVFWSAPLAIPIQDAGSALSDSRAPWFFLWVQNLLRYGDAFWMGVAIPAGVLVLVSALPYVLPTIPENQRGRWFPAAGWLARLVIGLLVIAWLLLTLLEVIQARGG